MGFIITWATVDVGKKIGFIITWATVDVGNKNGSCTKMGYGSGRK